MINDENIMDLSDFAERDIKEEVAHIKESITALEQLIEAKEKEEPEDAGNSLAKKLKATIRENIEELSLPVEAKCDALEVKLNALQDSIETLKTKQKSNTNFLVTNLVVLIIAVVLICFSIFA